MSFVQYSINWARGEIFEGTLIGIAGGLILLCSLLFWKFGTTPNAKAMFLPLLFVGALFTAAGASSYFSNHKRIQQFSESYKKDPKAFVKAEKKRVEGFQSLYTGTIIMASVFFSLAVVFFWMSVNPHLRATALALVVVGLSGLAIDSFSKERADTYYGHIQSELQGADK